MKGFTGIKDQDREILLNIDNDKDLLNACSLNKYIYNQVCNDIFFRNRLSRTYPDTLKYKPEEMNWKNYFLRVVYYISKMKENYDYDYSNFNEGNPKIQYQVFLKSRKDKTELLIQASKFGEITLVKEAIKRGANINAENDSAL